MKQNQNKWGKTWPRRRGTMKKEVQHRETEDRAEHEMYGENKTRRFTRLETERRILENRRRNRIDENKENVTYVDAGKYKEERRVGKEKTFVFLYHFNCNLCFK